MYRKRRRNKTQAGTKEASSVSLSFIHEKTYTKDFLAPSYKGQERRKNTARTATGKNQIRAPELSPTGGSFEDPMMLFRPVHSHQMRAARPLDLS
jgi:hypothetical protein